MGRGQLQGPLRYMGSLAILSFLLKTWHKPCCNKPQQNCALITPNPITQAHRLFLIFPSLIFPNSACKQTFS